ncbi:hypothetical protein U1Q18_017851 [Sarracenia purpurea var. burkii]
MPDRVSTARITEFASEQSWNLIKKNGNAQGKRIATVTEALGKDNSPSYGDKVIPRFPIENYTVIVEVKEKGESGKQTGANVRKMNVAHQVFGELPNPGLAMNIEPAEADEARSLSSSREGMQSSSEGEEDEDDEGDSKDGSASEERVTETDASNMLGEKGGSKNSELIQVDPSNFLVIHNLKVENIMVNRGNYTSETGEKINPAFQVLDEISKPKLSSVRAASHDDEENLATLDVVCESRTTGEEEDNSEDGAEVPVSASTKVSSDVTSNVDTNLYLVENYTVDVDSGRIDGSANKGKQINAMYVQENNARQVFN